MQIFRKIGSFFLDILETIVIALAIFVLIYLFLFQPHQVRGSSMYPNFHDKEYLLTDKVSYRLNQPKRGDVIVFKAPGNEEYDYIKRIIALPGEQVRIQDSKVFVDSRELTEPYLSEIPTASGSFWQEGQTLPVPEGHYLVMGDNRNHSSDSRDWGSVPQQNIIGKAWFKYWPVKEIGFVPKAEY